MPRLQRKKPASEKNKIKRKTKENNTNTVKSSILDSSKSASTLKKTFKKKDELKIGDPNFLQRAVEFLKEVQIELKKVTWPTKKQTSGTTIVVVIFVFVVAAFLGLFDLGLSKLVQVVLT